MEPRFVFDVGLAGSQMKLRFPKQSLTDGVLTVLYKRGLGRFAAPVALPGTIFYCNFRYLVIPTLSNARRNNKKNAVFAF